MTKNKNVSKKLGQFTLGSGTVIYFEEPANMYSADVHHGAEVIDLGYRSSRLHDVLANAILTYLKLAS